MLPCYHGFSDSAELNFYDWRLSLSACSIWLAQVPGRARYPIAGSFFVFNPKTNGIAKLKSFIRSLGSVGGGNEEGKQGWFWTHWLHVSLMDNQNGQWCQKGMQETMEKSLRKERSLTNATFVVIQHPSSVTCGCTWERTTQRSFSNAVNAVMKGIRSTL